MNLLKIVFSFIVGILFIVSAILKLYPVELLELDLGFHLGISEQLAMIFARLLIGFEMCIGISLILQYQNKFVIDLALVVTILFSFYLTYLAIRFPYQDNCGCMGMMVPMTPLQSLGKNLGLILLLFFLRWMQGSNYPRAIQIMHRFRWLLLFLGALCPFFMNSIDLDKTVMREEVSSSLSNDVIPKGMDSLNEDYSLAYYSPHCVYCKMMARKWVWLKERNHWQIPLHVVFMGEAIEKDISMFLSETGLKVDSYQMIQPHLFVELTHGSMPAHYFVKQGIVVQKDNFISFNEENMNELLSH